MSLKAQASFVVNSRTGRIARFYYELCCTRKDLLARDAKLSRVSGRRRCARWRRWCWRRSKLLRRLRCLRLLHRLLRQFRHGTWHWRQCAKIRHRWQWWQAGWWRRWLRDRLRRCHWLRHWCRSGLYRRLNRGWRGLRCRWHRGGVGLVPGSFELSQGLRCNSGCGMAGCFTFKLLKRWLMSSRS